MLTVHSRSLSVLCQGWGDSPWVPQGCSGPGAQRPARGAHRAELPLGAAPVSSRAPGDIWVWRKVHGEGISSAKLQWLQGENGGSWAKEPAASQAEVKLELGCEGKEGHVCAEHHQRVAQQDNERGCRNQALQDLPQSCQWGQRAWQWFSSPVDPKYSAGQTFSYCLCNICLSLSADGNQIQIVEGSVAMCERFVSDFGEFNERVGKELELGHHDSQEIFLLDLKGWGTFLSRFHPCEKRNWRGKS